MKHKRCSGTQRTKSECRRSLSPHKNYNISRKLKKIISEYNFKEFWFLEGKIQRISVSLLMVCGCKDGGQYFWSAYCVKALKALSFLLLFVSSYSRLQGELQHNWKRGGDCLQCRVFHLGCQWRGKGKRSRKGKVDKWDCWNWSDSLPFLKVSHEATSTFFFASGLLMVHSLKTRNLHYSSASKSCSRPDGDSLFK